MFSSVFDDESPSDACCPSLEYVVNHVFFPIHHPEKDDYTPQNAHKLACAVHAAACAYNEYLDDDHKNQWPHITKMLENLQLFIEPTQPWQLALRIKDMRFDNILKNKKLLWDHIILQFGSMKAGDVLVFPTPYHITTCGVIFRRQDDFTLYEAIQAVTKTEAECSHPALAIEIPNVVFDDEHFRYNLAGLLCGAREELLTEMLRGVSHVKPRPRGSLVSDHKEARRPQSSFDLDRDRIISQLSGMTTGDVLVFHSPYPREICDVTFRKQDHYILYEALDAIRDLTNKWRMTRSYPQLAIQIPHIIFDDKGFLSELASFLRGTSEELFTHMLRGAGRPAKSKRIVKHPGPARTIQDHGLDPSTEWSRSALWFVIRFAIQSSLDRSPLGHTGYKAFMLFLMYNLANHAVNDSLSSFLIHSMSAKILRRFNKLSSVSQQLRDAVMHTCTSLSQTLDQRWQEFRTTQRSSSQWDPSQLDLVKDTQPFLPHIHEYISISSVNHDSNSPQSLFFPDDWPRVTLNDFLSDPDDSDDSDDSFSISKIHADSQVTCYDIEQAVMEDIDAWVAGVTDVDKFCEQLERLVHQYQSYPNRSLYHLSIMRLTIIELWIALDKLVVKEIPILADYSPEIPSDYLSWIRLQDAVNIHRLSRAFKYILSRHAQAHSGWSVFSSDFSKHSFPCRYYDSSPHLQHLRDCIEDILPPKPLQDKVVVFELQCPVCFDVWRSVTHWISRKVMRTDIESMIRIRDIPALEPHILSGRRCLLSLYTSRTAPQRWGGLYYVYEGPSPSWGRFELALGMQQYLDNTMHTSNEVLAAQVTRNCHHNLPLHEFIAFAHLRSGGSLQWFNILRELRGRTLDFRRQEVYLLLAQASAEVGPLDSTGQLLWHQELQDSSFCHILLDELRSLFVDMGVGSLDGPAMAIISLLAGILVSRSSRDISEQAIQLLQNVRRKTFSLVHELLYDVRKSSTNVESLELLRDIAVVCRSSFDVGGAASYELFHSVQDVEIALSCAMLISTIGPPASSVASTYSETLLSRDHRLSLVLEGSLRDAIEADTSDIGVDRAVQMVWPGYRPSPCRWKPLGSPNSCWLVCETAPISNRRSQTVHVNLLDGSLLVDSRPIGTKLPSAVTQDEDYKTLFASRELMVVASDLPGMDFVTISVIYGHLVHFAVREYNDTSGLRMSRMIVRAQRGDTGDIFEYIPRRVLEEDLPTSVIADHVSWFNPSTSVIEIRPITKPWEQSSDNWSIRFRSRQLCVTKGGETLVGKRSATWAMVSSRLRCLDNPENLIITVSPVDTTQPSSLRLSITLPRYGLSFFVNEVNDLESRDFKDMVYDEDQCIETLFGLANRLVLRRKTLIEADLIPKLILIPHGDSVYKNGDNVYVRYGSSGPVRYYTYQADRELGCLKGIVSTSPKSRLYLARLHALTTSSGCRPDPLTGRTGVEEAISLICLAGTRDGVEKCWCFESKSSLVHFASANIQPQLEGHRAKKLRRKDALSQEVYLSLPSEVTVAAGVQNLFQSLDQLLDQLLLDRPPPNLLARADQLPRRNGPGCHHLSLSPNIDSLLQLFSPLWTNQTPPPFQSQYLSRLHSSAYHLQTTRPIGVTTDSGKPGLGTLRVRARHYYAQCRINYTGSLNMVKEALGPITEFERILERCGQWPRATPFTLFRCLASTSTISKLSGNEKNTERWKKCLISLALLALDVQRARRLLQFALDNLEEEFYKELENEGCDESDLAKHPDWLLIQLQGNFLIRRVQADIAKEMMSPRSGRNTVMQVNMGEGKSSVIIPICAAALADGNQLVRVIVPRTLIPQTLQVLTDRLCGLVNKPIHLLTFSRDKVNYMLHHGEVERLHKRVVEWRDEHGIIVMQPEDVLSLRLACVETQLLENEVGIKSVPILQKQGFECVLHVLTDWLSKSLTENTYVFALTRDSVTRNRSYRRHMTLSELMKSQGVKRPVKALTKIQKFFEIHARDILDESDDILRPQLQLIYATGHQHPFEGSPDRWVVIQQVLGLVKRHAYFLSTFDSRTVRCDGGSCGSFPHIHVLQAESGAQLKSLIAQDVLDGRLPGFSLHSELGFRETIREFMLRKDIHPDTIKTVEKYARQCTFWGPLLLLRGLLAHDILLFVFTQRRWRVDYGLDVTSTPRTMLAIPYRAKDVPTEMAEFGHPDITILLTCLSYYYEGLSKKQLEISFKLLLQEDDPSSEYALWLEDCGTASVPDPLRKLSGVNIRSLEQWVNYLAPLFSKNKKAIDLYLSKVVFAKHAKECPLRISGSYWHIAERKNHLVTGFSGTSDRQCLLPTSIAQDDPDHLRQTGANARVLAYILQPENASYMVTADEDGGRWTTHKLLGTIVAQDPKIRVLLDVGAQILDLTNRQLAEAWLDRTPSTETAGAIYFSEDDELMVLERNGSAQPLSSSPLIQKLHRCVAYLDNAHTRGTDIKFPLGFRAAITLGHKVTKDSLVQGCMRMRELGHGHSVMFFAPHEVDQRIRGLVAKENPSIKIATADILHWAIHETWNDIQRHAPYWAHQGMSHQSRQEAWSGFCEKRATAKELAEAWVQPELKSLADMYMPSNSPDPTSTSAKLPRQIRERCETLGVLSLRDVRMDEEQEKEVSREIEREREVERFPGVFPAPHCLHPDVTEFVKTGVIFSESQSRAFYHVFATGAPAASTEPYIWSPYILATADFCQTIQASESVQGQMHRYMRPVQWVVSGKMDGRDALVILSPFEVDQLMPEIRISEHVHLHLYIPRTTKRMKPADDLRLYAVPPLPSDWTPPWDLIDQLNIFAGQLYLSGHASYVRLCRFLGVSAGDLPQNAGTVVLRNWLRDPDASDTEIKNRFEGTPLPLVVYFLAVRRGLNFSGTHMGRILDGWPLSAADFHVPPDPATSTTINRFEQEEHSVSADLIAADAGDEQGPTMTRKRTSDSEEATGRPSKRKRRN
ncbi:hypothetical protein EV363DRAFT_1219569 [Boletus edulis]|nr:hypothetical protein EV363DRAFT_1219569 [Boletus edulis]